jgi:hypothetical protein
MLRRIILSGLVISAHAFAGPQTLDCQTSGSLDENLKQISEAVESCPTPSDEELGKLCKQITQRHMIPDAEGFNYFKYHDTFETLACAKGKSEAEIRTRVQAMWSQNVKRIKCSLGGYNLHQHNFVKYAISMPFNEFISDLVETYQVDLNFKDPVDNKTPLEFCLEHVGKVERKIPPNAQEIRLVKSACEAIQKGLASKR